jgi:acyl-CoA reductase-like NAD-dependent aldehyde dehydrogenase
MMQEIEALMEAQGELAGRPVAQILGSLDRVLARWLDPLDPIRQEAEARLEAMTGLAPVMLRRGLDDMIRRAQGIGELLDQDLGSREALDGFVGRAPGILSRAWGPGLLTCVFSGNVPGIPAFDLALGLALKSACLVRPASGEPVFAELFARSLLEEDELLGRCVAVHRWGYDDASAYSQAGAVLAYGSDETVAAIRRQVAPGVRFLGHGHKISFALVARDFASMETARHLALDVAMYDQQGCVSPHMAFVERGGELSPQGFALACAEALAVLEGEMPRARLSQGEALALRSARDEAEFTADHFIGSPGDLAWAVAYYEAPAFLPSPLNRLLRTYGVDDLAEVAGVVAPYRGYLQTVALAGDRGDVVEALSRLGVSRVCPVGRAQQPGALWRHDGRPTAGDLVRWTDLEVR